VGVINDWNLPDAFVTCFGEQASVIAASYKGGANLNLPLSLIWGVYENVSEPHILFIK